MYCVDTPGSVLWTFEKFVPFTGVIVCLAWKSITFCWRFWKFSGQLTLYASRLPPSRHQFSAFWSVQRITKIPWFSLIISGVSIINENYHFQLSMIISGAIHNVGLVLIAVTFLPVSVRYRQITCSLRSNSGLLVGTCYFFKLLFVHWSIDCCILLGWVWYIEANNSVSLTVGNIVLFSYQQWVQ